MRKQLSIMYDKTLTLLKCVYPLRVVQFETVSICNYSCNACVRDKIKSRTAFMPLDLIKKILRQSSKVELFYPFLNGEPMLHPEFFSIMDLLEDSGKDVILITNGSRLTIENIRRLSHYNCFREFQISCHGYDLKTYCDTMKQNNWKFVSKAIKQVRDYTDLPLYINYVLQPLNNYDKGKMIEAFPNINIHFSSFHNWAGAQQDYNNLKQKPKEICKIILHGMYILSNGIVTLCCMDFNGRQSLGNINDETIDEIWQKSQWVRNLSIRKQLNNLNICKQCNMDKICI